MCLCMLLLICKKPKQNIYSSGAVRWSENFSQPADPHSQVTAQQTSQTVFFSHNKPTGIVFFNQVSDQRTGPVPFGKAPVGSSFCMSHVEPELVKQK